MIVILIPLHIALKQSIVRAYNGTHKAMASHYEATFNYSLWIMRNAIGIRSSWHNLYYSKLIGNNNGGRREKVLDGEVKEKEGN